MNFGVLLWFLGVIVTGFVCMVLCFMLYLHYLHQCYAHLPGPTRSSFILGNLPELWKYKKATGRTFSEFVMEQRFKYGSIFVLTLFHRPMVYLADPSYVREVFINNHRYLHKSSFIYDKVGFVFGERALGYGLVTNTDEFSWRKKRHIMNPAFHRKCLKDFMSNFNNISRRFLVHMGKVADSGEHVSMVKEFSKVTLEAISQVSFNINTNAIGDPESPFSSAIYNYTRGVQDQFDFPLSSTFLGIFQFKLFQKDSQRVIINSARFLRKFASDCISARQQAIDEKKDVPNDLLSLLINDGSLTKEEIIDEFLTIFFAGQETTANSLAFTLYEILSNPHVEAKLLSEIKEVLGDREEVEFEDLAKLNFTGQVLQESLRKHPITAGALSRILEKEITIAGYQIPKGSTVATNNLFFAMNPETWKDPDVFDPERFANPGSIPNLSMTHFPFSVGPRNCIGQTFAKFESKVILAKLFQKFKFKLLPNQTDRMLGRFTNTPRDGVICEVSRCAGH
ncbi:cholesterol 24-hydroxylase-like isoform X2 [Dendronephthya gigantea]|uniref:cholesterol 24-hydroxylase-like isoform X1 n=1 Tax=Dendronephthya gigantea TaxID=151771 RepID=UPI001069BFC6|nr:cholesterol 24-hydroxylase-like isoform X1 [Dendronephthya gigantea]XP_028391381.1 cholesterol 24-hydroxylase-like isoform X2 [Dendronephthya gigantea]